MMVMLLLFYSTDRYIHHISEPMLVEQYVVICDYVKQDESDISLQSGNVVDVIEKYEHGKQSAGIR